MRKEEELEPLDIKEDSGFVYLQFITEIGTRFKDIYLTLLPKLKKYREELKDGEGWGIKVSHRKILLEGSGKDMEVTESIENLLSGMSKKMERGVEEEDYEVLARFTKLFTDDGADVVDGLLEMMDMIELKGRLFINCCFVKKLESELKGIKREIEPGEKVTVKEFNKRVEKLTDRAMETYAKLPGEDDETQMAKENFNLMDRANSLMKSLLSINNIFESLDFSDMGIDKLPPVFSELLNEWETEVNLQCKIIDKVIDEYE